MIAHRGFLGRTMMLLALSTVLPQQVPRAEWIQAMLHRAVKLFNPDERQAALLALEVDVHAECEAGECETEACRRLCEQVEAWSNMGRKPVVVRLEKFGHRWVRVRFLGPGSYSAEVFSVANGEEISTWMQVPLATRSMAITAGAAAARSMDADIDRPGEEGEREVSVQQTHMARETDFDRSQRMAMSTPTDLAMNRTNVRRIYKPTLESDWPPRYSAKPKPPKPPIDPEVKAEWRSEQRQRKALKAKKQARRGWS